MALKLFHKNEEHEQDDRVARLEQTIAEMGSEMSRMKQEVDTIVARQQGFRIALRRLREYLEERGVSFESKEKATVEKAAEQNLAIRLHRD